MKRQYVTDPVRVRPLARHDQRWLTHTVKLTDHDKHPTPMAAIAVAGGRLLGEGRNNYRASPEHAEWSKCSLHAEAALARSTDLTGSTVYVARTTKNKETALARPCRRCYSTLVAAGVRKVVYTTKDGAGVENLAQFGRHT